MVLGSVTLLALTGVFFGGQGGQGGQGGAGDSGSLDGGGGGGGQGGDGLEFTTSGNTVALSASSLIEGGAGGGGGAGGAGTSSSAGGGAGGTAGDGIFAGDGNEIENSGTIRGGAGGLGGAAGGSGSSNGSAGGFGAGIVGSDLTVVNTGGIAGGLDNLGIAHGDAIDFRAGTNALVLGNGGVVGTLNGNVEIAGTLDVKSGGSATVLAGGLLVFDTAGTMVKLESGVELDDKVESFVASDGLDLAGVTFSTKLETVFTASVTGGTLRIVDSTHPSVTVAAVSLLGTYTSGVFGLSSDGSNGTTIGFAATPSLGMQAGDVATSSIPGSSALVVVDRYNADYSLYNEDTITKASNGNYTFHFQGGSFFNGKSFAAFDNVTNSSGLLLNQTLYNSAGQTTQQTQFNANGSVYLQDNVVYPAAGQVLYQYRSGTFFTGKSFSAFDNLATAAGNTLLDQLLYNRDGSHTFTVPGSGLTLTAAKTDTFNVTGQNETTRFNATGFGADTFNGYKAGDIFSFSTSIFANYAALQQHVSGTSSAVITTSANDTLTLTNVAASSLTSSMFKFA